MVFFSLAAMVNSGALWFFEVRFRGLLWVVGYCCTAVKSGSEGGFVLASQVVWPYKSVSALGKDFRIFWGPPFGWIQALRNRNPIAKK